MKAKPRQAVLSSHSEAHRGKSCYTVSAPSEAPGLCARQGRGLPTRTPGGSGEGNGLGSSPEGQGASAITSLSGLHRAKYL